MIGDCQCRACGWAGTSGQLAPDADRVVHCPNCDGTILDIDIGDPMDGHKCEMIAKAHSCAAGREFWLGKLLEPIPGYPQETHCLHVKTPAKSVVFGVNLGDMAFLSVFGAIVHGVPFNVRWLQSMERAMRAEAKREPVGEVRG